MNRIKYSTAAVRVNSIAKLLLKANQSDFLLSQYVRKLSLHSVVLFFSNEGDP